jgi:hypothetical protein
MKRSAPAAHVLVERFGLWNGGIAVLVLLSSASLTAWLLDAVGTPGGLSAVALAFPLFALRPRAFSLRWDGQVWHLGPAQSAGDEPWPVELAVRVDLGAWVLLQVRPSSGFPRNWIWLPIQKRGLEPAWHALRCALFAAGPVLSTDGHTGRVTQA